MIVDNKEVITEVEDTEMCSSACDVAMEMCSSQSNDTCGDGRNAFPQKTDSVINVKVEFGEGEGKVPR